jgi:hypothetical protein
MLARYMREKLQIEKKKREDNISGNKISLEEKIRYESLRTEKKRILENIIFPSMANLIFFFESVDEDKILEETFKDEIEDLLGIRRTDPSLNNYGIFFWRLVSAIISIDSRHDKQDFRLKLTHQLHEIICKKVNVMIGIFLKNEDAKEKVRQDMTGAMAWTEMIAADVKDHYDFQILSEPVDVCKMNMKQKKEVDRNRKEKFEINARIEAPDRTLDFDTERILFKDNK